jgi:PAS domain S-box-containing protein
MNTARILVVEDEYIVALDIRERLTLMGYQVLETVPGGEEALDFMARLRPDLVLMDIHLQGDRDGISTAEEIHRRFHLPVVFLTAYSEDATLARAKLAQPYGYILKPFEDRELKSTLEIALHKHAADEEIRRLNRLYDTLSQVNQSMVRTQPREELLQTVCRLVVERGAMDLAWVGWLDPATARITPVASFGDKKEILENVHYYGDLRPEGQGNPGRAIREGKTFFCNACSAEDCFFPADQAPARFGFHSCASFPLRFQGQVCGALNVCTSEPGFFQLPEIQLLEEVAFDISFALDKIETDLQANRSREQLERQSLFMQALIEAIPNPIFYKDADLLFLGCNAAYEKEIGLRREQIIGKTVFDLFPEDLAIIYNRSDRDVLDDPNPRIYESQVEMISGERRDVRFHKGIFRNPDGTSGGIIGVAEDITERKQAEEALRESEERFRTLVDCAPEGIFVQSDGRFLFLNRAMVALLGADSPEKLLGSAIMARIAPEYHEAVAGRIRQQAEGKPSPPMEQEYLRLDGTRIPVETSAVAVRFQDRDAHLVFVHDRTAQKKAEAERENLQLQLSQAQKMESVGRLAGGVAHDFNNMLGIIIGNAELAAMEITPDSSLFSCIQDILKAGKGAADTVRQLLAFARKQTISPRILNLNDLIPGMLKMLGRLIGENIDLRWFPGEDVGSVLLDPTQVNQVLANLVVNSRDAISNTGTITLETADVVLNSAYCRSREGATPGQYVLLTVSDSGTGMPEEVRKHIFDPFFTTKEVGKGTGLGLATVYGIVKQNNGFIEVESEPGRGTIFRLYFPRLFHIAENREGKEGPPILRTGSETIFLVEDEEPLLNISRNVLTRLGYRVLTARSPYEALELAGGGAEKFDLLLTDVIMPQMNGRELAERIQSLQPDLKVLFMSGYTSDVVIHQGVLDRGVNFIEKPFSPQTLARKVREVLENNSK